jgi:MraZ protein
MRSEWSKKDFDPRWVCVKNRWDEVGRNGSPTHKPTAFMSAEPTSAPIYSGKYFHAFDGKNRITVPRRWRRSAADEFFLTPSRDGTFLRVMPPDRFSAAAEKAKTEAAVTQKEVAVFLRHFYSRAQHVEMDKQGRLLVPDEFCKALNLRGEIVLVGALEIIEMWSKEAWSATQRTEEAVFDRVSDLLGL